MFELDKFTYGELVQILATDDPFTFSRHKDGEFYAIFKRGHGHNCDKHHYYADLSDRLLESLVENQDIESNRVYGMQPLVYRNMRTKVDELFVANDINIEWFESDVLHHALRDGILFDFISVIKKREIVIVGPERVQPIKKKIGLDCEFVTIPNENCWNEYGRIIDDILSIDTTGKIIFFSASLTTAVMIHDLYKLIGKTTTMIDLGSIWEGLLGIRIRSYQRAMDDNDIERNYYATK